MIARRYESFSEFNEVLDLELQEENWGHYHPSYVFKDFIHYNLRLIIEQTQNVTNAQTLQKKLLEFSNKINETFTNPWAHKIAFKIMGIAQGIFSKEEDKRDYTSLLPSELRQKIYAELIHIRIDLHNRVFSGLESLYLVSKNELKIIEKTKIAWINNENIFLKYSGCSTIQKAIHFINNNQNLFSVNLVKYYLKDTDLKELQDCIWIQHLFISSDKITDEGIRFLKKMPLQTFYFSGTQLTNKAFEYLMRMPLKKICFKFCNHITDRAIEYLKGMPLDSVNFSNCPLLTDKTIEYLKEMPLQTFDLYNCNLITEKALKNYKQQFISRGIHKLDLIPISYTFEGAIC